MVGDITNEMLNEFAVTGSSAEVPGLLRAQYEGLLDRVAWYQEGSLSPSDPRWRHIVAAFRA